MQYWKIIFGKLSLENYFRKMLFRSFRKFNLSNFPLYTKYQYIGYTSCHLGTFGTTLLNQRVQFFPQRSHDQPSLPTNLVTFWSTGTPV